MRKLITLVALLFSSSAMATIGVSQNTSDLPLKLNKNNTQCFMMYTLESTDMYILVPIKPLKAPIVDTSLIRGKVISTRQVLCVDTTVPPARVG